MLPVTPTSSVDAAHDRFVVFAVVPLADRLVGADGGVVSPPPAPAGQVSVVIAPPGTV
jgi:hypothetical protein